MSEECKIIDSINITKPKSIIQTPCGKFLIGVEGNSVFLYNLKTKQKFRIAGSVDQPVHQDGTRDEARFNYPTDLTLSKDLKTLFITDSDNRVIRAICIVTGVTTTFAGQVGSNKQVDGSKEKACFEYLKGLKLSPDGNTLYVSDIYKLRTICITTGQVNTIYTIYQFIHDFTLSPDGKHIYILHMTQFLKYHLETGKSEIVLEGFDDFFGCDISKDGQLLFISNRRNQKICIVNLDTNQVIDTINTPFRCFKITISKNGQQLYVCDSYNGKIKVLDISNYCSNFKTFLKSQLAKHSFLPRQVIKKMSI
jgi:DNA-binding beta-propeller fold protein YncE